MRLPPILPCLALLLPCLVGCHSLLDDALDSYADGRYPSAAAQFRAAEATSRGLPPAQLARYALYRGLTHLALGDAPAAARWVGYAKQCAERDPGLFDDQQQGALLAAWRSMGHMPGEAGLAVARSAASTAQSRE